MVNYAILNMMLSLGFMMLIVGALLLLTIKSPSPSPSSTPNSANVPYAQNTLGLPRIGYYSILIGAILVIFRSFIAIIIVDFAILNITSSLGFMMLAGGILLLVTTKSPSPSNIPNTPNAYDWPNIGYYLGLIGIALIILSGLVA